VPDAIFADPRLAAVYDTFDGPRTDLEPYLALVEQHGARSVLDVGCGTGTLACLLAARGVRVVGLDPAAASLDLARRKPHAGGVRWVHGDLAALPPLQVDLVTMTGNVAQVFLTDAGWTAALDRVREALRPGGLLVLESRRPEREAWQEWTRERSWTRAEVPGVGPVETWVDVTEVRQPLVSFRWTFVFPDGARVTSDSTLRFRTRQELVASLGTAGLRTQVVREAPDRPGHELVVLARRPDGGPATVRR
jgi:SAM-dependent methyltransferase